MVQCLGICAFTTVNLVLIPGGKLRSCRPHCELKKIKRFKKKSFKKILKKSYKKIKDFSFFFFRGSLLSYNICVCACMCVCARVCVRKKDTKSRKERRKETATFCCWS